MFEKKFLNSPRKAISSHLLYAIGYIKSAEFQSVHIENNEERELFNKEIESAKKTIEKWHEIMKPKDTH